MISWKYSFEKVTRELELAKKKKQALDNLFNTGKISQSTYDDLSKSLTDAITEIDARQKALAEKMGGKIAELEQQIKTLETFLANTEIEYAAGEIDEELHERESSALIIGLEAARQQLNVIKEAMTDLFPKEEELVPLPTPAEKIEEAVEETHEAPLEPQIETPAEASEEAEPVSEETTYEQPAEAPVTEETEALPETPVEEEMTTEEESLSPSEEYIEETVMDETTEATEAADTEVVAEEAPAEEFSSFQDEEETTEEE